MLVFLSDTELLVLLGRFKTAITRYVGEPDPQYYLSVQKNSETTVIMWSSTAPMRLVKGYSKFKDEGPLGTGVHQIYSILGVGSRLVCIGSDGSIRCVSWTHLFQIREVYVVHIPDPKNPGSRAKNISYTDPGTVQVTLLNGVTYRASIIRPSYNYTHFPAGSGKTLSALAVADEFRRLSTEMKQLAQNMSKSLDREEKKQPPPEPRRKQHYHRIEVKPAKEQFRPPPRQRYQQPRQRR
jgi:hypothetical protein